MFETIGADTLILGVSIGLSLVGLGAVGAMLRLNRTESPGKRLPEKRLDAVVRAAPYQRLGNALKVAEG